MTTGTALYVKKIDKQAYNIESDTEATIRILKEYLSLQKLKEHLVEELQKSLNNPKLAQHYQGNLMAVIAMQNKLTRKENAALHTITGKYRDIAKLDVLAKDPNVHKTVAWAVQRSAQGEYDLNQKMKYINQILTHEYQLVHSPNKYKGAFEQLKNYISMEKTVIQQELGIILEEKKTVEKVETAKPANLNTSVEALLKESTLVLWGNASELNQGKYYGFSNGMQLRMVLEPGFNFKKMRREEWQKWTEFTRVFMYYPKGGVRERIGQWASGFNYYVYSFPFGSDHVGRSAIACVGIGYHEKFEPTMQQILNNAEAKKIMIGLLRDKLKVKSMF